MTARLLPHLSAADYHADPCEHPSLSASCATTLLSRSPYHAWLHHPRLGALPREATDSMDAGSLLHALVLGEDEDIVIVNADDWRTKVAQAQRADARASKMIPVLRAKYDAALALAEDVRAAITDLGIALDGESEASVEWTEDTSRGPVLCRGRMDHVWIDRAAILDLKTCQSAHPRAVTSHVWEYGYDVQQAAYRSAMRALRPEFAGRESFTFVFVEQLPEGSQRRAIVQPVTLSGTFREIGERRWHRACETWAECLESGVWPDYTRVGETMEIEAPGWALAQEGL